MTKVFEKPIITVSKFASNVAILTESSATDNYINSMQEWQESASGRKANIKQFTEIMKFE